MICGIYLCGGLLFSLKIFIGRRHVHVRLLDFECSTMLGPNWSLMEHLIKFRFCIRKPDTLNFLSSTFPYR